MNLTKEESLKSINECIENLYSDLSKGYSDSMINFLNFAAQMPKYSARNVMLLRKQLPTVSRVATFAKWKNLGRYIVSGPGSGLKILRPLNVKKLVKENGEDKEKDVFAGFTFMTVFDISQTEGTPIPEFLPALGNDDKGLYNILKECMIESGIAVTEKQVCFGGAYGVSFGKRVEIKIADLISMFSTLVHEYGHEILHKGSENPNLSKGFKECQAEATAYIVMKHYGFETQFCVDYIKHWGNSAKEVGQNLEAITKASKLIIEQIEAKVNQNELNQTTEETETIAC